MPDEWVEWHRGYDGPHPHSQRLRLVQERIREALAAAPPGRIRLVSLCAGDGRDLLGALEGHPRAPDVTARLIEQSPELVEAGRKRAAGTGIEFLLGDAGSTRTCAGAVPAEIVLVCGVFGNISDADVRTTIEHLPELCAHRATVIWTRGTWPPDLTPSIRSWFRDAGFVEESFQPIPGTTSSVGVHRLGGAPRPLGAGVRLFSFLPQDERPSSRGRSGGADGAGA